jgi:hypothetical protein
VIKIIEASELLFHTFQTFSVNPVLPVEWIRASIPWNLAVDVDIDDSRELSELFESVEASVCTVERRPY